MVVGIVFRLKNGNSICNDFIRHRRLKTGFIRQILMQFIFMILHNEVNAREKQASKRFLIRSLINKVCYSGEGQKSSWSVF